MRFVGIRRGGQHSVSWLVTPQKETKTTATATLQRYSDKSDSIYVKFREVDEKIDHDDAGNKANISDLIGRVEQLEVRTQALENCIDDLKTNHRFVDYP
jgi:hypothetical protein